MLSSIKAGQVCVLITFISYLTFEIGEWGSEAIASTPPFLRSERVGPEPEILCVNLPEKICGYQSVCKQERECVCVWWMQDEHTDPGVMVWIIGCKPKTACRLDENRWHCFVWLKRLVYKLVRQG